MGDAQARVYYLYNNQVAQTIIGYRHDHRKQEEK